MPTSSPEQMLADEVSALQQMLTGWSEMPRRSVGRVACGLGRVVSSWVQCKQAIRRGRRPRKADSRKSYSNFRAQREDVLNLFDAMRCPNGGDILRELEGLDTSSSQWMPAHAGIRNACPGQIARALASVAAWLPAPTKADASDDADWITAENAIEQKLVSGKGQLSKIAKRNPRLRRDATEDDRQRLGCKRLQYVYNINELTKYARRMLA